MIWNLGGNNADYNCSIYKRLLILAVIFGFIVLTNTYKTINFHENSHNWIRKNGQRSRKAHS